MLQETNQSFKLNSK